MFVSCVCLFCAGSGLCDELIARSEESYRVCVCVCVCLIVCALETATMRWSMPQLDCCATEKKIYRPNCVALYNRRP
jgi:hypothetical protein